MGKIFNPVRLGLVATNYKVVCADTTIMESKLNKLRSSRRWLFALKSRSSSIIMCILFKYGRLRHSDRTRKMNPLQATTILLVASVAAMAAEVATATGQLDQMSTQRSNWLHDCGAVKWSQCMSENIARTFRMLEQSDRLQIADGVRLVKTTTTTDRSTK